MHQYYSISNGMVIIFASNPIVMGIIFASISIVMLIINALLLCTLTKIINELDDTNDFFYESFTLKHIDNQCINQ